MTGKSLPWPNSLGSRGSGSCVCDRRWRGEDCRPLRCCHHCLPRWGDGPDADEAVLFSTGSLPHPGGSSRRKQKMTVERGMAREVASDDKHRQRQ